MMVSLLAVVTEMPLGVGCSFARGVSLLARFVVAPVSAAMWVLPSEMV